MTAQLLDGKSLAAALQRELTAEVADFIANNATVPALAVVLAGDNPASEVYVRNKQLACGRAGIESQLLRLPAEAITDDVLDVIQRLNRDEAVHGILVQLPLPRGVDTAAVLDAVHPTKDVDAFHAENVGLLVQGRPRFLPCTPHGVLQLLRRHDLGTAGKHVVIIGRSDIVGKPLANMLVQRGVDATVTVCHSRTADLADHCRRADILVAAIGQPRYVTSDMIRPGAVVIDVGMNRTNEGLCGDVDFERVRQVAGFITPVPGGVGPLTVTMLLANTLAAARLQVAGTA